VVKVSAANVIYSFSATHPPVARIEAGDQVVLETADCFSGQIRSAATTMRSIDRRLANPATGPLFISQAHPGTTLVVDILSLTPAERGLTATTPGMGVLGDLVDADRTRMAAVGPDGVAVLGRLLPLRPMLGVAGVAPARGEVSTIVPGPHGGNMDLLLAGAGTRLYIPVFQEGALFAAGDMHAVMGDGEVSGTGIETAGVAGLRFNVLAGTPADWPWLEGPEGWAVVVAGSDLKETLREATVQAVAMLTRVAGLDWADAYMLCGAAVNVRICQLVNPLFTVRAELPRAILGPEARLEEGFGR
jgi:amidase